MSILTFIVVLFMAYLLWRIVDQLPDVTFRLSEIQRDLAEIRRRVDSGAAAGTRAELTSAAPKAEASAAKADAPAAKAAAPAAKAPEPAAKAEEAKQE